MVFTDVTLASVRRDWSKFVRITRSGGAGIVLGMLGFAHLPAGGRYTLVSAMRLTSLHIKNFRGLQEVDFSTPTADATVIVGPNAMGKTTILEAIRLVRCLLMPAYPGEEQQTLQALNIISSAGRFSFDALLGDPTVPLEIKLGIDLTDAEIQRIDDSRANLAQLHLRNTLALPAGLEQIALVQFLSSPMGRTQLQAAMEEITKKVEALRGNRRVYPTLQVDPTAQQLSGRDLLDQEFVAFLIRAQPIGVGLLSYFPADRAMPTGEVGIQIGAADIQAQMHSHMGQPATKYQRLKQYIVNQYVMSEASRTSLRADFELIFSRLLPGKTLLDLTLNEAGSLSVRIKETASGAIYDIDSMSSGEKGLLLTFLLLRRSIGRGGIVLIDEPELHLNPTVTRKVLPFLIEDILKPLDVQAILCTHSPEILGIAYDRDDCALLHLRSNRDLSPILKQDKAEVFEAIKRLGAQTSDVLFMRGCVYVEGRHDSELLELGFPERVASFKLAQLGGRQEVEKEIRSLLASEEQKPLDSPQCFIFDLDRQPSGLQSKGAVRVAQWDRYCFENYLLDDEVIYDVLKDARVEHRPESRAGLRTTLRELALGQLRGAVTRELYEKKGYENPGLRPTEIDRLDDYKAIGGVIAKRLGAIQRQVATLAEDAWVASFAEECEKRHTELAEEWNDKWPSRCDGKRVLMDLHHKLGVALPVLDFKRRIITLMAQRKSETWRVADNILSDVIPKRA